MANNKIVYFGEVLMDLTGDTVQPDKLLQGYTAHDKAGEAIEGTCTFDSDTQDATASADELLAGETAYARGVKISGTMPNRGAVAGKISTKDGEYTVPMGFHDGSGKVAIDTVEQQKLIPGNIKSGVEILGVAGTYAGDTVTAQTKNVTPGKDGQTILPDADYDYLASVVIAPIPYSTSANAAGGTTVVIGA